MSTSQSKAAPASALIARGRVWHQRQAPVGHAFRYASYFVVLPMRTLGSGCAGLARNRRGLLSFYDQDHGLGGSDATAWVDSVLQQQGIADATGPLWLLTYPRVLGYAFKPVSLWYAYRPDLSLAAIVAEVNNTFGERHCYVLPNPALDGQTTAVADKVFHVSPFCSVEGQYRFQFKLAAPGGAPQPEEGGQVSVRVDLYQSPQDAGDASLPLQCLLQTGLAGRLQPITKQSARRAFWGVPLMTLMVVARIHWQALVLFLKRVPFFSKPPAPQHFVS